MTLPYFWIYRSRTSSCQWDDAGSSAEGGHAFFPPSRKLVTLRSVLIARRANVVLTIKIVAVFQSAVSSENTTLMPGLDILMHDIVFLFSLLGSFLIWLSSPRLLASWVDY